MRLHLAAACVLLAACTDTPTPRGGTATSAPGGSPPASAPTAAPTRWTHLVPGVVRPDQGTIEITVCPDRPQREFGNDHEFAVRVMPNRSVGKGSYSLLGIFVPTAPESGLGAILRTGKQAARVSATGFAFTAGTTVNLAITWGTELGLWADGRKLGSTPLSGTPDEALWPALVEIGRFAPFDPRGVRISSVARDAGTLDRDPATPFTADPDTTLVSGAGLAETRVCESRWRQSSGYAVAKPAWQPEDQCLAPGMPATFPLVVANLGAQPRSADLALTITPLVGGKALELRRSIPIPAGTSARIEQVPLPPLASDYWQVRWSVAGNGLPTLSGDSAIAVYPHRSGPADGALAGFYAVHNPGNWSPAPFTRMGVRSTRAWALSRIFMWHRIEPLPGRFRWEGADEYVDTCLAGGLEPLAVLGYPSRWAAVEPSEAHKKLHELAPLPERWKPADMQAWTRYVRAVAERYRGRVRHYEIYNEVNFCPPALPASFSGGTAEYLELQRLAYREIKAVDPTALVLSSGFTDVLNRSMPTDALAGGLADACDIFAVHGYSGVEAAADWVADWHRRRPGAPVWMTEQMWYQIADDRRRWWLTAAQPILHAAAGYERFFVMGVHQMFFDCGTLSPTCDQWVAAVLNDELRPCSAFAAQMDGDGAKDLDLRHRFRRSDGSFLSVIGAERGAMRVTLSAAPERACDLFGRPLTWQAAATGVSILVPDLAYLVSPSPLAVLAAEATGDAPLYVNGGFEEVDGDVDVGGLAAGRPRSFTLRDRTYDPEGAIRLSDRPRSGRHAVELSASGADQAKGRVYLFQEVKVHAGGTYEVSGWFRRDRGAPEPYLFAFDQDSGKIHEARLAPGGDGFQQVRLEVVLAGRSRKPLAIGWGIRGAGAATVDDVAFAVARPRFDHARFRAIGLAPAGNLPRTGWTMLLPGSAGDDAGALAPGESVLGGRSWLIGDGPRALVAVGDAARPALPRRIEIPVGGTAAALHFLHTALWVKAGPGEALGRYLVTYADGSTAEHPLVNQRSIADWYGPLADPAVPVAASFDGADRSDRRFYADRWTNPDPAKAIRCVTLEGAGNAVLLVVAVTAEAP